MTDDTRVRIAAFPFYQADPAGVGIRSSLRVPGWVYISGSQELRFLRDLRTKTTQWLFPEEPRWLIGRLGLASKTMELVLTAIF